MVCGETKKYYLSVNQFYKHTISYKTATLTNIGTTTTATTTATNKQNYYIDNTIMKTIEKGATNIRLLYIYHKQ